MSAMIKYINAEEYQTEVLQAQKAVVVDFYSTECPPCDALASKYESLSELYGEHITFLKIFRQENRALAESLDVKSSPTVLFYKNGEQVGDVLTGGIKRSDLEKNLENLLPDEVVASVKAQQKSITTETDLVIIGAGPAGLTAGIYAAQAKIDTIVIDKALAGGNVGITHQVCNFPGFPDPQPGFMLAHYMQEQATTAGVQYRLAVDITDIDLKNKRVIIDGVETITAKKLIIATGSSPKPLQVPGEIEYKGKGISYCATCDAKNFPDMEVVVIGGGNSAIEEALFITKFAKKVTIIHQFAELQANKQAQEKAFAHDKIEFILEHEPRKFIKHDDHMEVEIEALKTGQYKSIHCAGVFVFAGMQANVELFNGDLELDEWGYIKTDANMRTNIKDVYAAGDVASKQFRQITTAVSDGTIAAIAIGKELEGHTV